MMELAHERRGSGPPLVLIHGIGSHRGVWAPVADRLAERFEVIAVDLPGFGSSPPLPAGTPYTAETLGVAVEDFWRGLDLAAEPWVAGNSLGGYIALDMAARGVVKTATALSPAGFWSRGELAYARAGLKALRAAAMVTTPEEAIRSPLRKVLASGLVVAHPSRLSDADLLAAGTALRAATGFEATLKSFTWMAPPAPPKVPITVAWGERDLLLLTRRQAVRAGRWAQQRVRLLRGCGHVPMSDDPELVAEVIIRGAGR